MSKSNPHAIKAGQTLWFVPDQWSRAPAESVTIATVARAWATLTDGRRMSLAGLNLEFGRCHLSREAYGAGMALDRAWRAVTLPLIRPPHITAEDIAAIRAIVKGKS